MRVAEDIYNSCKQGDRIAQKSVYNQLSTMMFGVCRRYIENEMEAEDAMIKGFFKAFIKIEQSDNCEKFVGWIKKIMVNECLSFLRANKRNLVVELKQAEMHNVNAQNNLAEEHLYEKDLLVLLNQLPIGYRTIFNLYVIEGFSHKEIAAQLKISINTSKSQLIKARKKLKEMIQKHYGRVINQ